MVSLEYVICPVEFRHELSALGRSGVETLQQCTAAETERVMKPQDVLLKAMARKSDGGIQPRSSGHGSDHAAAERAVRSRRYSGLMDPRKVKANEKRVPLARAEEVL